MTTVIRAEAGQDFLALLPRLTGYRPRESIVLVGFRGNRTCGAIRFDLPVPAPAAVHRRFATSMIGMLCKIPDIDAVVPVAYTDESFGGGRIAPHSAFMDVLVHRAEVSGFLVRDALCVAADGWVSYLDPEPPAGGRPLDLIDASAVNAVADAEGMSVRGAVTGETRLPPVDLARSERVARRLRRLREDPDSAADGAAMDGRTDLSVPDLLEHLIDLAQDDLAPELVAGILWMLERPMFRDVALVAWAFGRETGERAVGDQLRYQLDDTVDESGTAALLWGDGPRPDPDRIDRASELLLQVAAAAPRSARVAPLTMLGWLSWALGRSSRAAVFVAEALAIDEDYGLASLIAAMIAGGRLPEWAFEVPVVDESEVRYADAPPRD